MPKVAAGGFSMDRKNDGMGNLSVATRRVTTENAPLPGFCETRKDAPGVLAGAPVYRLVRSFSVTAGLAFLLM